jgi:hypothetical protein
VDVATLTDLIEKALETKPFSISGNLLQSPSIGSSLTAFFGGDSLVLSDAKLKSKSSTDVVVEGQMTQELARLKNQKATVTFTVPTTEAQLVLALTTMPGGWTPTASFAQLKGSVFDEFSWSDPVLTLSSDGGPPLPSVYPTELGYAAYSASLAKAMVFGLGLTATVSPLADGGPLEWLLSGTAWQVSGPIVLPDAQVSAVLSTVPQTGVTVGGFSIPFAFTIASAAIQAKSTDPIVVASVLQLDAEVDRDVGGGKTFKLPFLMREGSASSPVVTVQSALPPGHGITPDEIGLLIGSGINGQVPHGFPALDAIQLEELALTLAPAAKQPLTSVSATIGWVAPEPYPVLGDLVTFNGMAVTFTYLPGGYTRPDGSVWHVMTDVAAQATVAGGTLDAELSLPDLVFSCVLAQDTSIDITQLVRKAVGDTISMPQINCTELAIYGDVTDKTYRFQATVTDDWKFEITPTSSFALTQIGMDISKTESSFDGEIVCQFDIAGTQLFGRASYGSTTGWSFELGTIGKADVDLKALVNDVLKLFGLQLPSNAPEMKLTALNFSFDSADQSFQFRCATSLFFAGTEVDIGLEIATDVFRGLLWVGDSYFEIDFQSSNQRKTLFATWKALDPKGYLQFEDIAAVFGWQMPAVPAKLDLALKDAELMYFFDSGTLAVSAHSANYGQLLFVALKDDAAVAADGKKPVYVFSLDVPLNVQLSDLPVVGDKLLPDLRLGIQDLEVIIASDALDEKRVEALNKAVEALGDKKIIPTSLSAVVTFAADLEMGGSTKPVVIPLSGGTKQLPAPAAGALPVPAGAPPPSDVSTTLKWFDVGKEVGIFSFQRIGVGYSGGELEFGLDASIAVGPIAFSMEALTVSGPLKTFYPPHFDFKGLALSFERPPVSIGGEFLKVTEKVNEKTVTAFYGEVLVGAANFSLKALGGWRPDPPPFFFIYVNVDFPIGGPPFLFVTGLAGGFGINSSLVLPSIDDVASYPLLPAKAPKAEGTPAETIKKVLPALQKTFKPEAGEYWVAAGIQFTTFEMVASQAVVSVAFGVEVQIGVVGTSAMTFPTGDPAPVAYVEVDIVASFTPSTGLLAVDGKLSPASYLFGGYVKLTGGFAFYVWFSGEHQGDFVVSLGGYHPAFHKPDNYPTVPRLALDFSLGPLKVTGQAYFALTPGAFMAGIRMSATFSAGSIKAWFDTGADFLIAWAPFHYEADAFVLFGCSVDLGLFTLTVHIGAALEFWGPAFGGEALIDLDVVSFTIAFGARRTAPLPVGWKSLSENFLPPAVDHAARVATLGAAAGDPPPDGTPNIVTATVASGRRPVTATSVDWIIDPDQFRIVTSSTVPANHALWRVEDTKTDELPNAVKDYTRLPKPVEAATKRSVPQEMKLALDWDTVTYSQIHRDSDKVWEPTLNVAPMDKPKVAAYHTVSLKRKHSSDYIKALTVAPQLSPSTTALWGAPGDGVSSDPNADRLLPSTLTGLALSPVPRFPDVVNPVPLFSLIFARGNHTGFDYQPPIPPSPYVVTSTTSPDKKEFDIHVSGAYTKKLENKGYELSALVDAWVVDQRKTVLDELTRLGFETVPSKDVDLSGMAKTVLTNWPHAALIGASV